MNKLVVAIATAFAASLLACSSGSAPEPTDEEVDVDVSSTVGTMSYTLYECSRTGQTYSSYATCKSTCGGLCINIGYCTSPGHCVYR